MEIELQNNRLQGVLQVPSDKSIAHRAFLLGAICNGETCLTLLSPGEDLMATISVLRSLGIKISCKKLSTSIYQYLIEGKGMHGFTNPMETLDCKNSGTSVRLLLGLLSGQNISAKLTGDESLQKRPMKRITEPLSLMGGSFNFHDIQGYLPLQVNCVSAPLKGINYTMPIASAQLKSAILLAALYANGETIIREPAPSRDHTERLLNSLGHNIQRQGTELITCPCKSLSGFYSTIPGDFSSAAFFIVGGLIAKDSNLHISNVGLNPTRTGLLSILIKMGANISYQETSCQGGEPVGDIYVKSSTLHGIDLSNEPVPYFIDEIPVLAFAAAFAQGETIISNAGELRVKESDRLSLMAENLSAIGVSVTEQSDGLIIKGGFIPKKAIIKTGKDHRIAMTFALLNLLYPGYAVLDNTECIAISYPGFMEQLKELTFH